MGIGVFLLTIIFTDQPASFKWNPWGPFEFTSYEDCRTAGDVIVAVIGAPEYRMTCASKDTGEILVVWYTGPAGR